MGDRLICRFEPLYDSVDDSKTGCVWWLVGVVEENLETDAYTEVGLS